MISGKFIAPRPGTNTKTANDIVEVVMEVLDLAPAVSPDGRAVVFMLSAHGREVEVARATLEEHFWLPPDGDAARTLKTFENGRNRIIAVAQRKLLARPDEPLWLTVNDFLSR